MLCLKLTVVNADDKEDKISSAAPGSAIFGCPECGDFLSSQGYLNKHMQDCHAPRPQKRLGCSFCPYTTNKRDHLVVHVQTHTGSRPFSCPSCIKKFTHKANLVRHQRVHRGEKPYKCATCGWQFRDASNLARHTQLHFDDRKPHACRYCGKAFRSKGNLERHLEMHTRKR
ncbi:uncharacterized protein LOC144142240 [Haemaphysalis longicornis]